jgi:hypothetical protein
MEDIEKRCSNSHFGFYGTQITQITLIFADFLIYLPDLWKSAPSAAYF